MAGFAVGLGDVLNELRVSLRRDGQSGVLDCGVWALNEGLGVLRRPGGAGVFL